MRKRRRFFFCGINAAPGISTVKGKPKEISKESKEFYAHKMPPVLPKKHRG